MKIDVSLRVDRARWWALQEQPFWGQLAMNLVDVFHDDPSKPTACTDGERILWNTKWVDTLDDEELRYVVLHEVCHPALKHLWRLPADIGGNVAGDYEIERVLRNIKGAKMPKGALVCPPDWEKLAGEEIYPLLPIVRINVKVKGKGKGEGGGCGDFEEPADGKKDGEGGKKKKPKGGTSGGGSGGDDKQDEGDGTGELDLEDQWERNVFGAAQNCQNKGNIPANMERVLERMRETPIDWRQETAEFIRNTTSHRNDWSRSPKRHSLQPVIYPRRKESDVGLVIFHRDTSGSVSNEDVAEASAHITSCLAACGCRGLVIDCDAEIHQEIWLGVGDECPLRAQGGGGTSHIPVWNRVAKLKEEGEEIAGIVSITDCCTSWPADDGGFPTLVLSTTDEKCPFGRTVKIRK